jgi:hypothetical protein
MADAMKKIVVACGFAGLLTVAMAAPALAQAVVVDPYYGGPYGAYAGPYGAYPRAYRSWDYPAGYDTGGAAYSWRDLGWQPGPPGAAPANPCTPSQREQNRC